MLFSLWELIAYEPLSAVTVLPCTFIVRPFHMKHEIYFYIYKFNCDFSYISLFVYLSVEWLKSLFGVSVLFARAIWQSTFTCVHFHLIWFVLNSLIALYRPDNVSSRYCLEIIDQLHKLKILPGIIYADCFAMLSRQFTHPEYRNEILLTFLWLHYHDCLNLRFLILAWINILINGNTLSMKHI